MTDPINQEHEDVLNFAHSLPTGLTQEQIYVRIHERAREEFATRIDAAIAAHNEAVSEQERLAAELAACRAPALTAAEQPADGEIANALAVVEYLKGSRQQDTPAFYDALKVVMRAAEAQLAGVAPAPESQPGAVAQWIRDHYQDHPNVDSLCTALTAAFAAGAAPVPAAQEQGQPAAQQAAREAAARR